MIYNKIIGLADVIQGELPVLSNSLRGSKLSRLVTSTSATIGLASLSIGIDVTSKLFTSSVLCIKNQINNISEPTIWPWGQEYPGLTYLIHNNDGLFSLNNRMQAMLFLSLSLSVLLVPSVFRKYIDRTLHTGLIFLGASALTNGIYKIATNGNVVDAFYTPLLFGKSLFFNMPDLLNYIAIGLIIIGLQKRLSSALK